MNKFINLEMGFLCSSVVESCSNKPLKSPSWTSKRNYSRTLGALKGP